MFNHSPHPRAFSLVEAAIVLGIVGLVIGGIFAATARVNHRAVRGEIAKTVSLAVQQLREDYARIQPVDSGQTSLHGYLRDKGTLNWPYIDPSRPWIGLRAPDGSEVLIEYHAANSTYTAQTDTFTVGFSGINSDDCYYYLSAFSGYRGVLNGHGNYLSREDIRNGTGDVRQLCIYHLSRAAGFIFPR